ncbi:MAG: transcription termination/antitermination protein NusG [Nitrospinae bacterium]|nr:transcription termination/antitermination protein NusG [Nitrospinota bacterium]
MVKKWYVIHTYSGFEGQVKASLEERIKSAGLQDFFARILIPSEDVMESRGGKKRVIPRKFFPGYVLVEMEMSEGTWYLVKNTPKVTGFLGGMNDPTPLLDHEAEQLLLQLEGKAPRLKHKLEFERGETVKVVQGPFANFTGVIDEVNPERGKLKVMVSIFGRSTPLELEFSQVEKV